MTPKNTTTIHEALVKAQMEMDAPKMSGKNPHFNSKFSRLDEVLDVAKKALNANGLAVFQPPVPSENGVACETILVHTSGEEKSLGTFGIPVPENNPQKYVAALTYCRRASLASALGLCGDEDDDGNTAAKGAGKKPTAKEIQQRFIDKVNKLAETLGEDKTTIIVETIAGTANLAEITDQQTMIDIVSDLEANIKKEE